MEGSPTVLLSLLVAGLAVLPLLVNARSPTPNIHICHSLTCPGQDGFYAHPTFCTDYVHCVAGVPYVKRCPSNLNFNAVKGACDHPRDAPCAPFKKSCELTIPFVPGGVTDDLVTCDCEGPCIKPHPYNCDAFYHCDAAGVEHLTECPGDLMFNAMVEQCDLPENTKCEPAPTCSCDNCRYPSSEMCSVYWQCEGGQAVQYFCSSGLLFNRDTSQCDLAINVDCSEGAWEEGAFLETACVDRRLDCPKFVKNGGCQCSGSNCDWQSFVLRNCPKSCGSCKENQIISKRKFALEEKGPRRKYHGSKESGSKESGSKESGNKESGSKESGGKESASKESASKESGGKESGNKESGTKESGNKGSGSNEFGSKESGNKESASKESGSKESASKESGSKESGSKESASKESASKESASKGQEAKSLEAKSQEAKSASKESGSKESASKESGSKESGSKESASKESASKESGSKESASKESRSKESGSKESASKESRSKESGSKESGSKESASKESGSKESASKESASKESASKESASKESGSKESASKESASKESGDGGGDDGNGGGDDGNGGGDGDGGNGGGGGDGGNGGGGGDGGNGGNGGSIDGCVIDCSLGKYLPHPSDCRKFIQCAPYGPEEMPCAPGTVWNQQKLTCDHEWASPCVTGSYLTPEGLPCGGASNVNEGGSGGNGDGGGDICQDEMSACRFWAANNDCYCKPTDGDCSWQEYVAKTCPKSCGTCNEGNGGNGGGDGGNGGGDGGNGGGDGGNGGGDGGNGDGDGGNGGGGGNGSGDGGNGDGDGGNGGGDGDGGNGGGGGDGGNGGGDGDGGNGGGGGDGGNGGGGGDGGNGGNGGSIDGCVIDCSLGKYLPHPSDCRKFIQCAPYGPEEMPCAPGTVWNQQKLTCDHEWASPCVTGSYLTPEGLPCGGGSGGNGGGGGDGGNGGGGGDGGNGGGGGDGGNGGNGGSIDGCVIDCSLGKYLPHPSDCRKFIQCAPYGPEEMPCAPGTVWNQQKLTCDHEWASPCVTGSYLTPEGLPCGGASNVNEGGSGGNGDGGGDICQDEMSACRFWAANNDCYCKPTDGDCSWQEYVAKTCPKSCGTCNEGNGGNGGGDGGNGGGDGGNGGGDGGNEGGDGGNGGGGGNGSGDGGNGDGDGGNGGGDGTAETEVEVETVETEVGGDGGNGGNGGSIDGCIIDCSLGKYLPHPSDCRKFIQCAPYGPEEMPCAPGTVWNQQKLTCDHEWASPCVTGSYLTPEGLPCGGASNVNEGGSGGNGDGGGDICQDEMSACRFWAANNDCYCKPTDGDCSWQEYVAKTCPKSCGTCNEGNGGNGGGDGGNGGGDSGNGGGDGGNEGGDGGNGGGGGNGSGDGGNGDGDGGNGGVDGDGGNEGGDEGEECPFSCPEKEGLFSHPRDCKKWIHCSHSIPFVKKCPLHLHFNPVKRVCDWPFNAQCIATPDADCQIPESVLPTQPPDMKPDICDCECCLRPHPEDCTAYYYCEPNASAVFHTCSEGLVFNPQLSQCVLQVDYPQCQPERHPTCDPTCECLYPAQSCSEYYICNGDGIPVKYECMGGLYFNDQKHTCDLPENVSCEERGKRNEIDPTTEQHYILPEECKDLQGMYAIKDTPSSYYLCNHGVAFEMRCPDGGVFSSKAKKCILRK
ncbi:LOW QUALITY PROTEIN: uncharacterized transmembrane protein DDB_G0289901-like [Penaeus monodon]|uniref:LOW QUALITY PROTEIN: uncharacterized transmembrane protein DDB_G0289901-like n=1 Tax=Penaeus monodon TaxID=6687 RepID=UPI0018A7DAF2|nr:LOW QUALITY PROTEIN: uncharacterized transmembrane protein DDB_G0289901-like [Penaeus monodon]